MVAEIVEAFAPVPDGLLLDATVGGGGHAAALLAARDDLRLLGLDRDPVALEAAATVLDGFGDRVHLRRARFDALGDAVDEELASVGADEPGGPTAGGGSLVGALFDLGVSSPQLDVPGRGFSYRHDGPLDMRMGPDARRTADDVVNTYPLDRLAQVLRRFGDERFATRIARAVVAARPVRSTGHLAEVVRSAIPAATRRTGGHPATRTFQAIRIEVNEELSQLPGALHSALERLSPGGRCAVLSYHSGEHRIVAEAFRQVTAVGAAAPPGLPVEPPPAPFRPVGRARRPSPQEVLANRRAEAARLRIVERAATDTAEVAR
jgi:16S rRNA (cytosine1402-N4)-methyltransferase